MNENQLIKKHFYETFLSDNEIAHPIRVLGESYIAEQQKELPDLAKIRFAQGELYFHHKDYEAAIFKWENINNELEPWAKKNMADAYFLLELYKNAEEMYKSVTSDSLLLNMEIGLQLFAVYMKQKDIHSAYEVIGTMVELNPDYLNVTELARNFYEEQQDWPKALELIVGEAIRTESTYWFDLLKEYVEEGRTRSTAPSVLNHVLKVLMETDYNRFEDLMLLLSKSYRNSLSWINLLNTLFGEVTIENKTYPTKLASLFEATYEQLMDGQILLADLEELMPPYVTNWLKVMKSPMAAAAVLSWNELMPIHLSPAVIHEAENLILDAAEQPILLKEVLPLFNHISKWATGQDIELDYRLDWLIGEMTDMRKRNLLVAEMSGNGKSSFINFVLGENVSRAQTNTTVYYQYHRDLKMTELTANSIHEISSLSEFDNRSTIIRQTDEGRSLIDFKHPSPYLFKQKLGMIDTPGINSNRFVREEVMDYLHAADGLLFVLNPHEPLRDKELEIVLQMREQMPELPIHFLLKIDHALDVIRMVDETTLRINQYFPQAGLFTFGVNADTKEQEEALSNFLERYVNQPITEGDRAEKVLYFMKKLIQQLLEKRAEVENSVNSSINWSEDMLSKLNGAIHQLDDLQGEKIKTVLSLYSDYKTNLKKGLVSQIPQRLKSCSDMITEDSDFATMTKVLNAEMNKRLNDYLQHQILPDFYESLKVWIHFAKRELQDSQEWLNEKSETFNQILGEEKIKLVSDFSIVEDWHRDAKRMTSGFILEEMNILMKFTPTQLLLRGAGKLLGSISPNNSLLYQKYKSYVENENYDAVTHEIMTKFFLPFELLEKSIERDLKLFFVEPFQLLNDMVEEMKQRKETNEAWLTKLQQNPELFRDPLLIFEIRLRHYEWMLLAVNSPSYTK
jgi:tetratricopeptide (TPR) repeat protein